MLWKSISEWLGRCFLGKIEGRRGWEYCLSGRYTGFGGLEVLLYC